MEGSTLCKCTSVYSQIYCSALQPQGSAARNMIGYLRKVVKQNAQTGNCLQPLTCIILVQLSGRKFQPPQKLSETFPIWLENGILHWHSYLLTLLKKICLYYDKDDYGYNEDTQHVLRSVWAWQKFSVENPEHNSECGTEVSQCGKYSYGRSSSKGANLIKVQQFS